MLMYVCMYDYIYIYTNSKESIQKCKQIKSILCLIYVCIMYVLMYVCMYLCVYVYVAPHAISCGLTR